MALHTRTKTGRSPYLHMTAQHEMWKFTQKTLKSSRLYLESWFAFFHRADGWKCLQEWVTLYSQALCLSHFILADEKEAANELIACFVDLLSKQPPFKQIRCKIEKIRRKHEVAADESLDFLQDSTAYQPKT